MRYVFDVGGEEIQIDAGDLDEAIDGLTEKLVGDDPEYWTAGDVERALNNGVISYREEKGP